VIANNLELASQLGGTSLQFKGTDLVTAIKAFVAEYGITHIVMGRSRQPWLQSFLRRSILDRLLQTVPGVDVLIVDTKQ